MKLGTFMMPLHPPGRQPWQTLRRGSRGDPARRPARLSRGAGRRARHRPGRERHLLPDVPRQPGARDEEHRARHAAPSTCRTRHPAAIAAQVAMLDHMLQGRFIIGISPGGLMSDAEVFGNLQEGPQRDLPRVDQHGAGHLDRRCRPTTCKGNFFEVTTGNTMIPEIGQGAIIKPYQKPHPPIVVTAVAPHSKGVTEAAKRGWTPISANFLLPEWVASHWPKLRGRLQGRRHEADGADWRVAKSDLRRRRRQDGASATATARRARTTSTSSS